MGPWQPKRSTATEHAKRSMTHDDDSEYEHAESDQDAMPPWRANRGNATEHAKKRKASSSAAPFERQMKAKMTQDDDSECEHAEKSPAREQAKKRKARSSTGKGDRRVKPRMQTRDDDSDDDHSDQGNGDRGTAIEHAETQRRMREVKADRDNNTPEQLKVKLSEFLTYVLRKLPNCSSLLEAECEHIVQKKIEEWTSMAKPHEGPNFYGEPELMLHKKMWDVMSRDKKGIPKEPSFGEWCNRIATYSTGSTASAFRKLTVAVLTNDLTPKQMKSKVYSLQGGNSTKQRSLINCLLRKNLGDARVAHYIFEHGVPEVLKPGTCYRKHGTFHKALFQDMLEKLMTWHSALLQTIVLERLLHEGDLLAKLRNSGERTFDSMSDTEQQVLEDFDCNKLQKKLDILRVCTSGKWL